MLKKSDKNEIKTIVSHSNCGCYDFNIENLNNEIIFEKKCTGPSFRTGYYMPIDKLVSLAISYDGKVIKLFINGEEKMY